MGHLADTVEQLQTQLELPIKLSGVGIGPGEISKIEEMFTEQEQILKTYVNNLLEERRTAGLLLLSCKHSKKGISDTLANDDTGDISNVIVTNLFPVLAEIENKYVPIDLVGAPEQVEYIPFDLQESVQKSHLMRNRILYGYEETKADQLQNGEDCTVAFPSLSQNVDWESEKCCCQIL